MKNELNALIMEAMKNHDSVRTETLCAIKAALPNADGKMVAQVVQSQLA